MFRNVCFYCFNQGICFHRHCWVVKIKCISVCCVWMKKIYVVCNVRIYHVLAKSQPSHSQVPAKSPQVPASPSQVPASPSQAPASPRSCQPSLRNYTHNFLGTHLPKHISVNVYRNFTLHNLENMKVPEPTQNQILSLNLLPTVSFHQQIYNNVIQIHLNTNS
jgi:hypothetical protein